MAFPPEEEFDYFPEEEFRRVTEEEFRRVSEGPFDNVHHRVFYLPNLSRWLLLAMIALLAVIVAGISYTAHEWRNGRQLKAANGELAVELAQTRTQLAAVTAKVDALTKPLPLELPAPADEAWAATPAPQAALPAVATRATRRPVMARWQNQMQRRLVRQEREIVAAREDLERTQTDIAHKLGLTHGAVSELSGTIARNHAQLVALEKLGERNYYEFDLDKSKLFQTEGGIGISLRHTNTKHQTYDVVLLVDDIALTKKHVNLYEPLMFETRESPQPLRLVVNQISKNHIHGYVSELKAAAERTAAVAEPAGMATSATPEPPAPPTTPPASLGSPLPRQ
ncbi:MAG: hypothetical protein ACRD2B_03375 [Terriglobia bacterium]